MNPRVFIHIKCRKASLLPGATLVFKTLRGGFPTADVRVSVMPSADGTLWGRISDFARESKAEVRYASLDWPHDRWIESLVATEIEPFWIVDPDVVFHDSMETLSMPGEPHLVGRLEPAWDCELTRALHVERLHTCCLWVNPSLVRERMRAQQAAHPCGPFAPEMLGVRQTYVPERGVVRFYDTMAGIYQTIGGTPFTPEQNARFDHINCGTWLDEAAKGMAKTAPNMRLAHEGVYRDPASAKGLWTIQQKWYEHHAPRT